MKNKKQTKIEKALKNAGIADEDAKNWAKLFPEKDIKVLSDVVIIGKKDDLSEPLDTPFPNAEYLECPKCGHKFKNKVTDEDKHAANRTVSCPKCNNPIKIERISSKLEWVG